MTRVAAIQSSYVPWKGYFDIIHDVDLFLFLDDVQYTTRDWRNRNRVKTSAGLRWLTIPTGSDRNRLIHEVGIADDGWAEKHWRTLRHAYGKAPHFRRYEDLLHPTYFGTRWENLSALNQALTKTIARELGIRAAFEDSRAYAAEGAKLERLVDLVRKAGATSYVSGPSARAYIREEAFREAGIELVYKSYDGYPEYPQLHPPFVHEVSILDLLFHTGPEASRYIWGWRGASEPGVRAEPTTPPR